ncbi:MAG TPA: hypothetical protein VGL43_00325, partial [Casimicrobiaceae bacterium]
MSATMTRAGTSWKAADRRNGRERAKAKEMATGELPRMRALVLFGALAALFVLLLGRSLYLQWLEND